MTYKVAHRTVYEYDRPVSASYGETHLHPREAPGQQTYVTTLAIDPVPEHYRERRDFFGNRAAHFTVLEPHTTLTVASTSVVEVRGHDVAGAVGDLGWEDVRRLLHEDPGPDTIDARQFTLESPSVPAVDAVTEYAAASMRPGRGIVDALADLVSRIHADFEFSPGATTVSTPVEEVFARRVGVCQDFAHLTITGLRGLGLAARYVSGYLETLPPPGRPRLVGADVSHAWVSVHVPQVGWLDIDPTNDQFANERYVTVAWGRDYGDVAPLKGIIYTKGESSHLTVTVDVARIDDDDPALRP